MQMQPPTPYSHYCSFSSVQLVVERKTLSSTVMMSTFLLHLPVITIHIGDWFQRNTISCIDLLFQLRVWCRVLFTSDMIKKSESNRN